MDYFKDDSVIFSKQDILDLRKRAGNNPVTPLIVQNMIKVSEEHYKNINIEKSKLYKLASEILINGSGKLSLSSDSYQLSSKTLSQDHKYQTSSKTPFQDHKYQMSSKESEQDHKSLNNQNDKSSNKKVVASTSTPISLVKYNDPMEEMEELVAELITKGKIPLLWSKARGLVLNNLSKQYPLFSDANISSTSDPKEILKFIIGKPQGRIAYILEDFHHYIGERDIVNPAVGEIRSLIKELNRSLESREDEVYLFVPASYDMPPELSLFFSRSPKQPRKAVGYLERYGQLLTDARYIKTAKPLIGAEATIDRLIQVLTQMEINNPLLVGYPGVGKSAVVEGLAMAIVRSSLVNNKSTIDRCTISDKLKGKKLYSLSLNSLIAGTKYRGDLEIRLQGLMDEVLSQKDRIIIFIDEIHTLLDAGSTEGSMSAGEFLKPLLARGEFPCIGATTFEGERFLSKDTAFSRRFKKIIVNEPSTEEAIEILRGVARSFESHHGVSIDDGALIAAVKLSGTYLKKEYLPGKAISLIDGAAAYCNMQNRFQVTKEDIKLEIERL
ncbi:MAG: ATP-dependent Clp protease ATP-binding subunit [Desulfamplus sp.]|nr:ATP-dependent Clp protease ATP-binding subunit [Desulfamplus sp.]